MTSRVLNQVLRRNITSNAAASNDRAQAINNGPVKESLAAIRKFKHLNAFTFVASEELLEEQLRNAAINSSQDSPLRGLPIVVKDNFCVRGMPATCGSKMLSRFDPQYNATVVEKLINAGVVVMGKTNMDEFGMGNGTVDSIHGPTKNVWGLEKFRCSSTSFDDWHVPGGSSGGSAVAVAAGLCFGAIGSDTGGSTRNPASYCGVVGLKPTYGTVSRHGLIPLVNSMDVPGILTKNVVNCAVLYDTMKGWDSKDSTTVKFDMRPTTPSQTGSIKGFRIGVPKDFQCEGMAADVIECWKSTADILEKEGAQIQEVSLPHTKYSIVCYSVLNPCEVASNMARYDGLRYGHRATKPRQNSTEALYAQTRHEGFNLVVRGRILAGNYFLLKSNYDKYFLQALKVRRLIQQDFENVWEKGVDLLLTPCTLTTAPKYTDFLKWDNRKQSSVQDYCTQSANMAGVPALSMPIKLSQDGLPLSLQLIGPRFSENKIFEMAKFVENLVRFPGYKSI
ncbi:unnamed protein product [Orchesella dallaii]|uniref:Glutamyl-tRNA(Gln) amidotransferase subunit A, mitochondrial n=1 Tax=Orchesella dallaii TaxID=48710 RepID=A0ABP1Q8K2_9HEXA